MPDPSPPRTALEQLRHELAEIEAQIAALEDQARRHRGAIAEMEGGASGVGCIRLRPRNQSDNDTRMLEASKVRHSEGAKSDKRTKRFLKSANDHRHSMRSACEAVGLLQPAVSQALRGLKSIKHSDAVKLEKLIGYEATQANWPRLRLDE